MGMYGNTTFSETEEEEDEVRGSQMANKKVQRKTYQCHVLKSEFGKKKPTTPITLRATDFDVLNKF